MDPAIELLMIVLMLSDMALLGLSRLNACIRIMAFQGILLGFLTLLQPAHALTARLVLIAAASIGIKGFVFPYLLRRAIEEADVQRELEPYVGYTLSILIGMLMFGVCTWIGSRLPLPDTAGLPLVAPTALMTMFTGLFLIVARRKALSQCLGYIVLENGIYAFGMAAVGEVPALIELGMLLDAFVAVLVMGIAVHHINREFDHTDAAELDSLRG